MATTKTQSKAKSQLQDDEESQLSTCSDTASSSDDSCDSAEEDGPTEVSKSKTPTDDEAEKEEDERVLAAVANDPRFNNGTNRRLLRFVVILKRGKAAMDLYQKEFDFSDDAADQVEVGSKWIECSKGNYVKKKDEDGTDVKDNFRQMTEMEKTGQDNYDCGCEICTSRKKFQKYVKDSLEEDRAVKRAAAHSSQMDEPPQVTKECR